MPPQLTYSSRRLTHSYRSPQSHPYDSNPIRYAKSLPPCNTMNEQSIGVVAAVDVQNTTKKNANKRKKWRKNKKNQQAPYQEGWGPESPSASELSIQDVQINSNSNPWQHPQTPFPGQHLGEDSTLGPLPGEYWQSSGIQEFAGPAHTGVFPTAPYPYIPNNMLPAGPALPHFQPPTSYQSWFNSGYTLPPMALPFPFAQPAYQAPYIGHISKRQYTTSPSNYAPTPKKPWVPDWNSKPQRPPVPKSEDNRRLTGFRSQQVQKSILPPPKEAPSFAPGPTRRQDKEIKLPPPKPTLEYLKTAEVPAKLVENPDKRRLLVALDLNGTLLCRKISPNGTKDKLSPMERRNLRPFLNYIFQEHEVIIFSSAMPKTILVLSKAIFPANYRDMILDIFTREDMDIPSNLLYSNVSSFKRLSKVWDRLNKSATMDGSQIVFDQTNTVLLDDTCEKAATEPHNLIEVPEYTIQLHHEETDDALGQVAGYIEELRKWDNVSSYIRASPFNIHGEYVRPNDWVNAPYKSRISMRSVPIKEPTHSPPEQDANNSS
ncbi:hypothetical protein H072_4894 [Dactylellina haptotyla CBS 200.50]|uniref:Mitochondrial import inner membrane translocase subunit TIM50 n=1 Tax=Dactylellina haptotyla (strain CBS 200.50) TaxID=1284197 RepID=S8AJ74_DACHA|nr:hypothetical protein H072_4894 [Dactylellina haptotyla CBS 200.50]